MADDDRQIRPFADWLAEQRGGLAAVEVSEALNDLLEAVMEYGRPGDLTLVVHVKPAKANGAVFVTDDIKLKKPQPDRASALFFVDGDHNLTRDDPRQPRLPLREVPKAPSPAEAKEVPGA